MHNFNRLKKNNDKLKPINILMLQQESSSFLNNGSNKSTIFKTTRSKSNKIRVTRWLTDDPVPGSKEYNTSRTEKRKREDGGDGGNDEVVQIKRPRKE